MDKKRPLALIILAVALAAFIATAAWTLAVNQAAAPLDDSAEAGFARDMGDHHQQAVDMSFTIHGKSTDQQIKILAFDIINTQATQRGMLMGWLDQWELPQTTARPALAWMNNASIEHEPTPGSGKHDGLMPGMATTPEIDQLGELTGREADILFLQLMIRHHQGGIVMAEGLLERSDREEARRLAQAMVDGQQAEIEAMRAMLKDRGARSS